MATISYLVEGPQSPANPAIDELACAGSRAEVTALLAPIKQQHADDRQPYLHLRAVDADRFFVCIQFYYLPSANSVWKGQERILNHTVALLAGMQAGIPTAWEAWQCAVKMMGCIWHWQDERREGVRRGQIDGETELGARMRHLIAGLGLDRAVKPPLVPREGALAVQPAMECLASGKEFAASLQLRPEPELPDAGDNRSHPVRVLAWLLGPHMRWEGRIAGLASTDSVRREAKAEVRFSSSIKLGVVPAIDWAEVSSDLPGACWTSSALAPAERRREKLERLRRDCSEAIASGDQVRLARCWASVRPMIERKRPPDSAEQGVIVGIVAQALTYCGDDSRGSVYSAWMDCLAWTTTQRTEGGK